MTVPNENLVGQKFNQLEVVKYYKLHPTRGHLWHCACLVQLSPGRICGNTREVSTGELKQGKKKTCASCAEAALKAHRRRFNTVAPNR